MFVQKIALSTGALCVLASSLAVADTKPAERVELVQSPGGHAFHYHQIPTAKRLAVVVNWPADVSLSPTGKEALSYLGPKVMLMGGADGKSAATLKSEFEDLDAGFNIKTKPSGVTVFFIAPVDAAEEAAQLANGIVAKPAFSKVWLARLKGMLNQRNKQALSNSRVRAGSISRRYALGPHPHALVAPFHSNSAIESVTYQEVVDWHRNVFVRKGVTITASGPANGESASKVIDRLLQQLPAKPLQAHPTVPPMRLRLDGKTIVILDRKSEKSTVMISAELPRTNTLRDLRGQLATQLLGQGPHSKLFQALRSELGLTYHVSARVVVPAPDVAVLTMQGEFETTKLALAVTTLKNSYDTFLAKGVQAAEFDAQRERYAARLERRLKRPTQVAMMMMGTRRSNVQPSILWAGGDYLKAMQRADVNADVAKLWPRPSKMLTVIVTSDATGLKADCTINSVKEVSQCRNPG